MSIWPRRRAVLPAYARRWLAADERVLTFTSTPGGDLIVATPRGLWITDHRPDSGSTAGRGETAPAQDDSAQDDSAQDYSAPDDSAQDDSAQDDSAQDRRSGRLLPWELIAQAKWSGDALTVISAEEVAPQIMRRLPPLTLALPESGDLPRVVRQRIERSVAVSHRRTLSAGSSVLLVGRRVSGRNGLLWYAVFDRNSDVEDPRARQAATLLLESAAAATSASIPD